MHPAFWLWKKKKNPGFWNQTSEETCLHLLLEAQVQRLGAEQDQSPCESAGTSSGNWQQMVTCLVQACDTLQQPLWFQGNLEGEWCCGQQSTSWMNNIKEWTSLPMQELHTTTPYKKHWQRISVLPPSPHPHPKEEQQNISSMILATQQVPLLCHQTWAATAWNLTESQDGLRNGQSHEQPCWHCSYNRNYSANLDRNTRGQQLKLQGS